MESKTSEPVNLGNYAVPQGSILGPLIFLIFNNDFPASSVEGSSVLFADDDTDVTSDKDLDELKEKIQREADRSTAWVADNKMVCAGDKTKLLILGTRQLKNVKHCETGIVNIDVCEIEVADSKSEKLLGLVVSNDLSWKQYLYGEKWRQEKKENFPGLIPQLSQRVGMLSKLVKMVPKARFKMLSEGIFKSKLLYCLQVFGNVWGQGFDEVERRNVGFGKEDLRKLQVLQNKVCRMKTMLGRQTSTKKLLESSKELSVHQLVAYTTLVTVHKIKMNKKPTYLDTRLNMRPLEQDAIEPRRQVNKIEVRQNLTLSRAGFIYRGSLLWNQTSEAMRVNLNTVMYKREARKWVELNVSIKPD